MKNLVLILATGLTLAACSHKEKSHDHSAVTPAAAPVVTKAQAAIAGPEGSKVKGVVHFVQDGETLKVEVMIDGVKAGPHGFHIHEMGDCSAKDFSSAGGHFNPSSTSHAGLHSEKRHAGDFGNVMADKKKSVRTTFEVKDITLAEGPTNILGKAVIIHADKDDLKSQPAGNSGKRIGCGVIQAM